MLNKSVKTFQGILGFTVLAAAGLLAWCHFNGLVFEERPARARADAMELASAMMDYQADTGKWPRNAARELDPMILLGRRSGRKTTSLAAGSPSGGLGQLGSGGVPVNHLGTPKAWIREIPLDPWGCSYRVLATDRAIAVLSTGPDGKLDTDTARLWIRPEGINPCDGDDVGVVLNIDPAGGIR